MQTKFHSRNFGVLEIILSVAILAAFSVFVLRLFVAASKDETRMKRLDNANFGAASYIEQFKAGATPFTLCGKLGQVAAKDGYYKNTVAYAQGVQAVIEIKKDSANAGGSLYAINVDMRSTNGEELIKLSGYKYFSNETGEAVG